MTKNQIKKIDYVFVGLFIIFAFTSFTVDTVLALGINIDENATNFISRSYYTYYAHDADRLMVANPLFLRIQAAMTAFIFGPFYVLMAYAFLKRKNWIRIPALMYSAAMLYGIVIVLGVTFYGDYPSRNISKFLFGTLPYAIVPILLIIRVRKPSPFNVE